MDPLKELVTVMEEEVQVGEELIHNLAAQKEAVLYWDSSKLLERIEEKEVLIRRPDAMEKRRQVIVTRLPGSGNGNNLSLNQLLSQLPPGQLTTRLGSLQIEARHIYGRLRLEEKGLVNLMENILAHIREALDPLSRPAVHLYEKKGTMAQSRPESGLVRGKI